MKGQDQDQEHASSKSNIDDDDDDDVDDIRSSSPGSIESCQQKQQRCWILDPIDGTRGLITGKQYVIGLMKEYNYDYDFVGLNSTTTKPKQAGVDTTIHRIRALSRGPATTIIQRAKIIY